MAGKAPIRAALALSTMVVARAAPALADGPPRTSALSWVRLPGAEACSDGRALAREVERRLGRAVFTSAAQASLGLEGRVEPARGGGFRAVLVVVDEQGVRLGSRELRSRDPRCQAFDDELVLVLAITIDPDAVLTPRDARGSPALLAALPPMPPPLALTLPPAEPAPPPLPAALSVAGAAPARWRAGLLVGAMFTFGLLPAPAAGVAGRAWMAPPGWPTIEVGGGAWLDQRLAPAAFGATFRLATGQLAVYPVTVARWGFELGPRVGVEVGSLRAAGFGFGVLRQQEQLVVNALAGAQLRRRLVGPALAALALDVAVPVERDRFYYTDAAAVPHEVFRMSPVALGLGLGLGAEIP